MPIIVPIEDNKVGLATATDAKFRAPDYSGSGLEALGAGLAQLGGGGQQLASGLEERRRRAAEAIAAAMLDDRHQSNIDDAAVKQAYVDYSDPTHEALHGEDGLFNRQGAGAHAAFPGLVETLVDNHDKALSKLDDIQRAAIAPAMNERLRNDVDRAADYVRQQGAAEQKWQSEQLQKAAARDAVNHADDPDLFDHHLATGENTIRQQAKIDKVGDRLLAKQIAAYKSSVHADTIGALTRHDPAGAADWYARFGDQMNDVDRRKVEGPLGAGRAAVHDDAHAQDGIAGDPGNPFTATQISPTVPESPAASRSEMLTDMAPDAFDRGRATPASSDDMSALFGGDGATAPLGSNGQIGGSGPLQGDPRRGPGPDPRRPPVQGAPAAPGTRSASRHRPDRDGLGVLSTQYETGGNGVGTVSSGKNDPGGISYGSYQMSTAMGTAAAFANSPEFSAWSAEFGDAKPGTPEFAAHWRHAAATNAVAFQLAQHRFIARTHYDPAVAATLAATGLDLDTRSNALRNVVWSTAVQHKRAPMLLTQAINETNKTLQPQDPAYDGTLIDNIYKARIAYVTAQRDAKLLIAKNGATQKERNNARGAARTFSNILVGRFAPENEPANGKLMWVLENDIEKNWGK